MNHAERRKRIKAAHDAELAADDLGVWWLSFCDPSKPGGGQFLGVVIVEAYGPADAMDRSHEMGINPGGEIEACRVPPEDHPESVRNRLLSKDELIALDLVDLP